MTRAMRTVFPVVPLSALLVLAATGCGRPDHVRMDSVTLVFCGAVFVSRNWMRASRWPLPKEACEASGSPRSCEMVVFQRNSTKFKGGKS